MKTRKILFLCRHNRFRSKIAEAYFKKINSNPKLKVYSAGIFKGFPVDKNVVEAGKKFGLKISRETRGLSEKLIFDMDVLVIVADDVPSGLFKDKIKKIIKLEIPDSSQKNKKNLEFIINKITKKIDELVKRLN